MAEILTPRSKVAKMLADIDNAATPSPSSAKSSNLHHETSRPDAPRLESVRAVAKQPMPAVSARGPFQDDSDDETEEGDPIRRPVGRAARRMLGKNSAASVASSPMRQPRSSPPVFHRAQEEEEDLYSATPLQPKASIRPGSITPLESARSANLFVSPAKSTQEESDNELPSNPFSSKDALARLVAQKREERLRREADEAEKLASRLHHQSSDLPEEMLEGPQDAVNADVERIMSDASRPTRKASKRALLEMERETQRLSRQQALAHQMKTKKRFTTSDLFARFNFRQGQAADTTPATGDSSTASSAQNSDAVEPAVREPVSTPPSSPPTQGPTPLDLQKAMVEHGALAKLKPVREDSLTSMPDADSDEELPDIAELMSSTTKRMRVKSRHPTLSPTPMKKGLQFTRLGKAAAPRRRDSSDDELEIVHPMPHHLRAFDNIKVKAEDGSYNKAVHILKHLSNMGFYGAQPQRPGKASRPSITPGLLEVQLRLKAKQQAREQQAERVAELRAKGVDIQTNEEREREAEVFENLLEKARSDAVDIRKAERAAAREAAGEDAIASDDEDEDEDYVGSGSEDEEGGAGQDEDGEGNEMVDDAADESEVDESEEEQANPEEDEAEGEMMDKDAPEEAEELIDNQEHARVRKARQSHIVRDDDDDDDDDDGDGIDHDHISVDGDNSTGIAHEDLDTADDHATEDPFAAFNFGANQVISPSQAFQATMQTPTQATQDDASDILRRIAPPSASVLPPTFLPGDTESQTQEQDERDVVPSSQVPESQRISLGWETQPPETPGPGLQRAASGLTETPGWEPTQDHGLPSPLLVRPRLGDTVDNSAEHDTQSTVQLRVSETPAPSVAAKRGRLPRRQNALADSSDDETEIMPAASAKVQKTDVFGEMARRRREALTAAERDEANREMKQMMDEQAEESEDEYAGIGGDDFVAPETEQDKAMIDSSHVEVDERALAAHYAERRRVEDEAQINQLYKDVTTGALRRKQANMFDLDEDEDEIAVRRRQIKQREEARKRKLLLQDDNIAGLAEGKQSKGKDAFLKAIADDDDNADDMLERSDGEEGGSAAAPESQSESQLSEAAVPTITPLQEVSGNKRRFVEGAQRDEDRPPAKQRRTQPSAFRKPASMIELQESLSFLLDEPAAATFGPPVLEIDSASEGEAEGDARSDEDFEADDAAAVEAEKARQNDGGFAPNPANFDSQMMPPPQRLPASQRRTAAPKPAVVDRLSLKRVASATASAAGPTAWAAPVTAGFKAPSLLRRATTSVAHGSTNDRGVSTPGLSREGSGVKMGGTKKSSLAYQARSEERRAIVEASAKRRQENTARIALLRRSSSMLNSGLTGRFE